MGCAHNHNPDNHLHQNCKISLNFILLKFHSSCHMSSSVPLYHNLFSRSEESPHLQTSELHNAEKLCMLPFHMPPTASQGGLATKAPVTWISPKWFGGLGFGFFWLVGFSSTCEMQEQSCFSILVTERHWRKFFLAKHGSRSHVSKRLKWKWCNRQYMKVTKQTISRTPSLSIL